MSGNNPTIRSLILFGRDPQQHLPFAQTRRARCHASVARTKAVNAGDAVRRMREKLQSEAARALHAMRRAIVEPVVGQIK